MLPRFIFCTAVLLATLVVILLALIPPASHRKQSTNQAKPPWIDLSLYIQQHHTASSSTQPVAQSDAGAGAFVFHRTLTEGPETTSRIVGKAQGFIIPVEQFAHSAFNIIYLTFETPEYAGSLSIEAQTDKDAEDQLTVVGGTGSFAFARGVAIFDQSMKLDSTYYLKLQLRFPNQSQTIPDG